MMESITLGGKTGTIVYLDASFQPVPQKDATLARVIFEDGSTSFLVVERETARRATGLTAAVQRAISLEAEWDESLHPRDDDGKFAESDGGGRSTDPRQQDLPGVEVPHHQKLIQEAERDLKELEPLIEQAIADADYDNVGSTGDDPDADPWEDAEFDDLSSSDQDAAHDKWVEDNRDSYGDDIDMSSWIADNIDTDKIYENAKDKFEQEFDPAMAGLDPAFKISMESFDHAVRVYAGEDPKIEVVSALRKEDGSELSMEEQEAVRGFFRTKVHEAHDEHYDELTDSDEYREALDEQVADAIEEGWNSTSDSEKLAIAIDLGAEPPSREPESQSVSPGAPDEYKWDHRPDEAVTDEDYLKTRAISLKLASLRTQQLMEQRGILPPKSGTFADPDKIADQVWTGWKGSSTNPMGLALQLAASEELGTVSRLDDDQMRAARAAAANRFVSSSEVIERTLSEADTVKLGMDRLKAYVRGQWGATQYILKQSGDAEVDVFRAVLIPEKDVVSTKQEQAGSEYTKLPELSLKRNAAMSATTASRVANYWSGVDLPNDGVPRQRVVLRFKAPREAVLSLPVFGQNLHNESEVVLLGTKSGFKWDAWWKRAPEFRFTPISLRRDLADKKPSAADTDDRGGPEIDIWDIDQTLGSHWLDPKYLTEVQREKPQKPARTPEDKARARERTKAILRKKRQTRALSEQWNEDLHPRDETGKFAPAGGGGTGRRSRSGDDDYLMTPSDAYHAIQEGKPATIVHEDLRGVVDRALKNGEVVDLAKLTLEGTPIFAGGLNLPRSAMPQIPKRHKAEFFRDLRAAGVKVTRERVDPMTLTPTQKEISALRTGEQLRAFEKGKRDFGPLLISKDNKVLDGHHRWAMGVVLAIDRSGIRIPVDRIHLTRKEALKAMHKFDRKHGIATESLTQRIADAISLRDPDVYKPPLLSAAALREALASLDGWTVTGTPQRLEKRFTFQNRRIVAEFVRELLAYANEVNHHPDIDVDAEVVTVSVTRRSSGGLTALDVACAETAEALAARPDILALHGDPSRPNYDELHPDSKAGGHSRDDDDEVRSDADGDPYVPTSVEGKPFKSEDGYRWHEEGPVADWADSLSKPEHDVVDDYAGFGYGDINAQLRGTFTPHIVNEFMREATPEEIAYASTRQPDEVVAKYGIPFAKDVKDFDPDDPTYRTKDGGRIVHNVFYRNPEGEKVEWSVQRAVPDMKYVADLKDKAERIDTLIRDKGYVLPEPVQVLRAAYLPGVSLENLQGNVGKEFEEKGFTSTMLGDAGGRLTGYVAHGKYESLYKRYGKIKEHEDEVGAALRIKINIPEGTKVLSVEAIRRQEWTRQRDAEYNPVGEPYLRGNTRNDKQARRESEILIGSRARYRITRVKQAEHYNSGDGSLKPVPIIDVEMEYVGGGSSEGTR